MLISNGIVYRNIAEKQLPEYVSKGYEAVKQTASPLPKVETNTTKSPAKKKGDK